MLTMLFSSLQSTTCTVSRTACVLSLFDSNPFLRLQS